MRLLLIAAVTIVFSRSAGGVSFRGFGFHNAEIYDFVVEPGNHANRWDSAKTPVPLSARQAETIASNFMKKIPADEGWGWELSKTRLLRITKVPEEWVYVVRFVAGAKRKRSKDELGGAGGFGSGIPRFDVVVQMNGKIPTPRIKKVR